jgi:RecA-family ATPase
VTARFIATSGHPPPLPWLIEDWLPAEETTLLAGPGSGGKSYLALQLQVSAPLRPNDPRFQ